MRIKQFRGPSDLMIETDQTVDLKYQNQYGNWLTLQSHHIIEAFGIHNNRWPDGTIDARMIGNVLVWVVENEPSKTRKQVGWGNSFRGCKHRSFARCPQCHKAVPTGRLNQHMNKAACANLASKKAIQS